MRRINGAPKADYAVPGVMPILECKLGPRGFGWAAADPRPLDLVKQRPGLFAR
jgi:hypothetical protein